MKLPEDLIDSIKEWLDLDDYKRGEECPFLYCNGYCFSIFPEINPNSWKCPCQLLGIKEVEKRFNDVLKQQEL